MSLAFQLPYGNEDFRLLGDINRVYSLPVDIIAELHTGIFYFYTETVLNPEPSVYQYNLRGSDYKDLRLLRAFRPQRQRETRQRC